MATHAVTTSTKDTEQKRDALVERLVESASSTMNLFTIHLGDQLGFYSILAEDGPMTAKELAVRSGTNERYVREWLEQQTVSGILEVEGLMYGFSVLHCLPAGMVEQPSAATGTVMRPDTLRKYALEAGFRDVEILPIENFFFRFYRLIP